MKNVNQSKFRLSFVLCSCKHDENTLYRATTATPTKSTSVVGCDAYQLTSLCLRNNVINISFMSIGAVNIYIDSSDRRWQQSMFLMSPSILFYFFLFIFINWNATENDSIFFIGMNQKKKRKKNYCLMINNCLAAIKYGKTWLRNKRIWVKYNFSYWICHLTHTETHINRYFVDFISVIVETTEEKCIFNISVRTKI